MWRFYTLHRRFFIGTLLLLFLLLFLSLRLQQQPLALLDRPLSLVIGTIQSAVTSGTRSVSDAWDRYIAVTRLDDENRSLRAELDQLREERRAAAEIAAENERLRTVLAFRNQVPFHAQTCRVIGRDPSNWFETLVIDRGDRDGLRVNMGVITPEGVVGRIIKTMPRMSLVLLVTDRDSAIAAQIQRSRDQGIVEGKEGPGAKFKYLPQMADVRVGDVVVTSGLAGVFPKGLMLGTVTAVRRNETELLQEVDLVPQVNFNRLEEVLVVTSLGDIS